MHDYGLDLNLRQKVWLILAVLSIAISYGFHLILKYLEVEIPWYIESPSFLAVMGILNWLFDKYIWKWKLFYNVPNYAGKWKGFLQSSFDKEIQIECTLYIEQTWSKISCKLSTSTSESFSYVANITTESGPAEGLVWLYCNRPINSSSCSLHCHNGVTQAKLDDDGYLNCEYYNCGHDRQTYGVIRLQKV